MESRFTSCRWQTGGAPVSSTLHEPLPAVQTLQQPKAALIPAGTLIKPPLSSLGIGGGHVAAAPPRSSLNPQHC